MRELCFVLVVAGLAGCTTMHRSPDASSDRLRGVCLPHASEDSRSPSVLVSVPDALLSESEATGEEIDAVSFKPPELDPFALASTSFAPAEAAGSEMSEPTYSQGGRWSVKSSLGFTLDPTTFLLTLEGDYFVTNQFLIGPLVQLGFTDNATIVAPTINFQYLIDLESVSMDLANFKPFVQGGLGFAYIHKDVGRGNVDEVGFLLNLGFGFEYYFTPDFALGNNVMFNIMPDDVSGENFFFSWQFVTFRVRF